MTATHTTDPAALLAAYWPLALSMARRAGAGSPHLADELESAATGALWEAAATWEPARASFPTHAKVRMRFALLDRLKLERRRRPVGDELLASVTARPELATAPGECAAELLAALAPGDRLALTRFVLDGDTLDDIARATGVSKQRVHQRVQRALAALRAHPLALQLAAEHEE